MKVLFTYLKEKLPLTGIYLLCAAVVTAAFALFRLPLAVLLYISAVCPVILMIAAIFDFTKYLDRHKQLCLTLNSCENFEKLPDKCLLERDYNALILKLCEEKLKLENETSKRYAEMSEYYTAWVHQIKTPIASMKLMLDAEDSQAARNLSKELFRIEQYVEMVLTYIRLDSESTDYVFRRQPLDPIIKGAVKKFAGQFIMKGLKLEYAEGGTSVLTDSKWLSFVLEQLISNAVKYTEHGSIGIKAYDSKKGTVSLCVTDTGIGIAAAELPRIFEKSYTGSVGRADCRATGIGLYLCKHICDRLGHTLRVKSKPGAGTSVYIDFDAAEHRYE